MVQAKKLDRWSKSVDMPMINGDTSCHASSYHLTERGALRGAMDLILWISGPALTSALFEFTFSRPECVGWHYCGAIDAHNDVLSAHERQHVHFFQRAHKIYPELSRVPKRALYQIPLG